MQTISSGLIAIGAGIVAWLAARLLVQFVQNVQINIYPANDREFDLALTHSEKMIGGPHDGQ